MKTIQRIAAFLLLLVFLFGTTGLSVFRHICHSSNENNTSVYPEFFKNAASSCCADELTGYTSAGSGKATESDPFQHFNPAPCCKIIISFFKLEILTVRVEKVVFHTFFSRYPLYAISLLQLPVFLQPLLQPAYFQYHSPPLFGKMLVQFLHQMKIPAHPFFA